MFAKKEYSVWHLRIIIFLWILSGIAFKLQGNVLASILFLSGACGWIIRLLKKKVMNDVRK